LRRGSVPAYGDRRRTRSASPANVSETTVASVQAALHRKQLQVHELKSRLTLTTAKVKDHQKTGQAKEDLLASTLQQLEREKNQVDAVKLRLEEATRQKVALKERLEASKADYASLEQSKDQLQKEVLSLVQEKSVLNETHQRVLHQLQTCRLQVERLEASNHSLSKEAKERLNLISQLEKVGSSLRDQLSSTQSDLSSAKLRLEKLELRPAVISDEADHGEDQEKYAYFKQREDDLTSQLEKSQLSLKSQSLKAEEVVKKLTDERLKLNLELNEEKSAAQGLKDQLAGHERQLAQLEAEKKSLEEQLKASEATRDSLEVDVRKGSSLREELDNQLTSLTLQKDALDDEVAHLKTEADELKHHLDRMSATNVILNKEKNELLIRGEQVFKDFERLQRQLSTVTHEKSKISAEYDDLQHDLKDSDELVTQLKAEREELTSSKDSLGKEMKTLKRLMDEEIAQAEHEKLRLEEERDDLKET
jgi:chromosome segregation ATPase